jgi:penicillin-binding protein 1A
VVDYVAKLGSGARAKGGSTITQQVAKNILIGDEYSVTRKLKEMILARRIEASLNKQQILELYLNEIPLGRQSFGVQAAARAYFDKDVGDLALHEAAFLAILPKAPERYGRAKYAGMAIERRNYVLDQMVKTAGPRRQRQLPPRPAAGPHSAPGRKPMIPRSGYFVEEVRRRLIGKFGEKAEDGPNSVYAGGLWVRTSLDPQCRRRRRIRCAPGCCAITGPGWHGPIAHIDLDDGMAGSRQLIAVNKSINYQDWRVGVVSRSGANGQDRLFRWQNRQSDGRARCAEGG